MNSTQSSDGISVVHSSTDDNAIDVVWVPAYWSSFIVYATDQQQTVVGVWLRLAALPVILLAGFLGNSLTMALMCRPRMRRHSYSSYLAALAASDSLALLVRLAFWINLLALTLNAPVVFSFQSYAACAILEYVCTANHVLCSWLVVSLTYERLIVVVFPLKSARVVKVSNSIKVVAALVMFSLILMTYVPSVIYWNPEAGGCVIPYSLKLYAHFGLATTFVSILPLLLICCGNAVTVLSLIKQSQKRKHLTARGAPTGKPAGKLTKSAGSCENKNIATDIVDHARNIPSDETPHQSSQINQDGRPSLTGLSEETNAVTVSLSAQISVSHISVPALGNAYMPRHVSSPTNIDGDVDCQLPTSAQSDDLCEKRHSLKTTKKQDHSATVQPALEDDVKAQCRPPNNGTVIPSTASKMETRSNSGDQQVRRVTFTLLCVSLAFLLLVMPNALLVLVLWIRPEWTVLQPFLDHFALLWDGNFAINFYLLLLTGTSFRSEVFTMLRCTASD